MIILRVTLLLLVIIEVFVFCIFVYICVLYLPPFSQPYICESLVGGYISVPYSPATAGGGVATCNAADVYNLLKIGLS